MDKFKKISYDTDYEVIKENLVDKVKQEIQSRVKMYEEDLLFCMTECESPIEQLMMIELKETEEHFISAFGAIEVLGLTKQETISCGENNYRVDFLLEIAFKKNGQYLDILKIIIECDGHEFHEKTKEQVIKDNERDRVLQSYGYNVVRFSGSEIYNHLTGCGQKIRKFIITKYHLFLNEVE